MLTDARGRITPPRRRRHRTSSSRSRPAGRRRRPIASSFAREVFATIPNLKDVRISSSEPLRIGGQQGHQIMARGRGRRTGAEITVVQWLRFGGGAYMQMVGIAPHGRLAQAYARFRAGARRHRAR